MKKLIIVIITFVLLFSCKNLTEKAEPAIEKPELVFPVTIKVDEARYSNEIPLLSNLTDDISYIKLKTPANTFVQIINDVQIFKNYIFIHENQRVMVFDRAGNYLRTIGRIGRGPNEYIYLRSFCINKDNEDLLFYTGPRGDIFRFNTNGDFIEKLFSYRDADYMYFLNDKLVFSGIMGTTKNMPENRTQIASTDLTGQKIDSKLLPIYSINNWEKKLLLFPGNFKSTKFDEVLLLYGYLEDTIFHVNGSGKIEPRYLLDFGKYGIPIETRYLGRKPDGLINASIIPISPPSETANNVLFKFAFQKEGFLLRYDKTGQKAFTFFYKGDTEFDPGRGRNSLDELGLVNDIDGGPDFFPEWSVYDDSTQLFISAKRAFDLRKELTPEYFKNRDIKFIEKKDNLIELVNNLEEKDDYVLMIAKLK